MTGEMAGLGLVWMEVVMVIPFGVGVGGSCVSCDEAGDAGFYDGVEAGAVRVCVGGEGGVRVCGGWWRGGGCGMRWEFGGVVSGGGGGGGRFWGMGGGVLGGVRGAVPRWRAQARRIWAGVLFSRAAMLVMR